MKRIIAVFIVFLLFGCSANRSNIKNNISYKKFSSDFELINANMEQGKYKKAAEIITFLINNGIKDVRLYYDRGICLSNLKMYAKAMDDFKYIIKNAKDIEYESKAYTAMGYCYYMLYDEDNAIKSFNEAIKLNNNYLAFYSLGYIYMKHNKYIKAKIRFYRAIEENAQFTPSYIDLSKCYIKLGEFERAKETLLAAANLGEKDPELFYNLGYVYDNLNNYEMSILYYTKAIELTPLFAPAYVNRGLVYLYLNKKDKACSDFKQACNLSLCDKLESLKQIGVCQ